MPLDKPGLKTKIITLLQTLYTNPEGLTTEAAREKYATDLSDAIDEFVRTGFVQTTGTASAQTGTIS
jgi:hypothetical protein